jgi:hypothetical protein
MIENAGIEVGKIKKEAIASDANQIRCVCPRITLAC